MTITMENNNANTNNKGYIVIKEKSVYGRTLMYPGCDVSNLFAGLIKSKTFTFHDLELIKGLGYKVELIELPK
jgi:hypothetical protein